MKKYAFFLLASLMCGGAFCREISTPQKTDEQIRRQIDAHRPLLGAKIPADIKTRLGATHTGGKYYLTSRPFIIEGCRKLDSLGFGVCKMWLTKTPHVNFPYNSQWNVPKDIRLKDLAAHPYYKACFDMPFTTFALNYTEAGNLNVPNQDYSALEEELYELAKYFLRTYKNREVTFIIQNWEGDWVLRGGTGPGSKWSDKVAPPANIDVRIANMRRWVEARQRGIDRARREVKNSKCRVYHAVEVNKVFDGVKGFPSVMTSVLPYVKTDMVSWSSYDGLSSAENLYKGIEYIRSYMVPTDYMKGKKTVYLGELGIAERQKPDGLERRWDEFVGVCLALDVPYLIHWELYCNEPMDGRQKEFFPPRTEEQMRGFWLIKPDGSDSVSGAYFQRVLKNAGRTLN